MHLSAGGGRLAQELRPQLGSGSPVHPGLWHGVSQRSQLSSAPAGTRVVPLSPPDSLRSPRPPRPWPHSFLGLRTRRARLDCASEPPETPGYSGTPTTSRPPQNPREPRRTSSARGTPGRRPRGPGRRAEPSPHWPWAPYFVATAPSATPGTSSPAVRAEHVRPARKRGAATWRAGAAGQEFRPLPGSSAPRKVREGGRAKPGGGCPGQGARQSHPPPGLLHPCQGPGPLRVLGNPPAPRGHFVLELRGPACRSPARSLRQASRPRAGAGGGEGFALEEPGVLRGALPLPPPPKPCRLGSLEGRGAWGLLTHAMGRNSGPGVRI